MTLTRPTLNFRECSSCLRDLSYGNFGLKRVSGDLYNEVCKECRNYRRKAYYYRALARNGFPNPQGAAIALPHVFPVNEQNRYVLGLLPSAGNHSLQGQFIKTGQTCYLSIRLSPGSFSVKIHEGAIPPSDALRTAIHEFRVSVDVARLPDVMVPILRDLRIRLD